MKFKKMGITSLNLILFLGILLTGCVSVKEVKLISDRDEADSAVITSSCDAACKKVVSNRLNLKNTRYRADVIAKTKLASIDGNYKRYSEAWHNRYKIVLPAGSHALTTRPNYCFAVSPEKSFAFNAESNNQYFVGDAVLEKGKNSKGNMIFSWTPVVFNITKQAVVFPVNGLAEWKEQSEVGGSLCL